MTIEVSENLDDYPEIRDHVCKINGWIFRSRYVWWIVFDEEWVAYAGLSFYDKKTFYLGPTFVKESHRGRKIQSILIKMRESYAQTVGIHKIMTFVEKTNVFSLRNLQSNGYEITFGDNYFKSEYHRLEKILSQV